MPNLNLCPSGHGCWTCERGAGGWDENVTMCVVAPKRTGPLAPVAGKSGAAGIRKKRLARGSRGV